MTKKIPEKHLTFSYLKINICSKPLVLKHLQQLQEVFSLIKSHFLYFIYLFGNTNSNKLYIIKSLFLYSQNPVSLFSHPRWSCSSAENEFGLWTFFLVFLSWWWKRPIGWWSSWAIPFDSGERANLAMILEMLRIFFVFVDFLGVLVWVKENSFLLKEDDED